MIQIIKNRKGKFFVRCRGEDKQLMRNVYMANDIENMFNDNSKLVLYLKSEFTHLRALAMFLMRNDISEFFEITVDTHIKDTKAQHFICVYSKYMPTKFFEF
jgi:hypothetical protein